MMKHNDTKCHMAKAMDVLNESGRTMTVTAHSSCTDIENFEEGFTCATPDNRSDTASSFKNKRRNVIVALVSVIVIILGTVCVTVLKSDRSQPQDSAAMTDDIDSPMMTEEMIPPVQSPPLDDLPTSEPSTSPAPTLSLITFSPPTSEPTSRPSNKPTARPSNAPSKSPITTNSSTASPVSVSPTDGVIYDAVIVGAGWSGIRAAQVLSNAGASVLVIEANDYIGGRSKTVNTIPGVPTDLGSEWLYTEGDYGSMTSILADSGLVDDAIESKATDSTYASGQVYSQQDGDNQAEMIDEVSIEQMHSKLWSQFLKFKTNLLKAFSDTSYADALEQFIEEIDPSNTDKQFLNHLLNWGEISMAGDTTMLSLSDLIWCWGEDCLGSETHYMSVPGVGFGSTAVSVADSLDADFKLNSKVVSIDYEDSNVIIAYEENGIKKKVTAQTALVTVSLGVLQAGTISFSPTLPESKQDAIDNMGFGLLNKCVMYWNSDDDIVWPEDYWFNLITPEDESSGMWNTFFNPSKLKGVPCLIGWIGGDEALAMEEQTDEEIIQQVMGNLRSMFPEISQPDEVMITRWGQDDNVRGSYSFNKVDRNFNDDASRLKERVGNIWFAGEATNLDTWQGTTVGAWDTGEEAGQDMVAALKRLNSEHI